MNNICTQCMHEPLCIFKEEYNQFLSEIALIKATHSEKIFITDVKCNHFYKQINPRICGGTNI